MHALGREDVAECIPPALVRIIFLNLSVLTNWSVAVAIEAMGMCLPYSSCTPAIDPSKKKESFAAGEAIYELLEKDIKPRDIMTKNAFENAIVTVMALGGILHFPTYIDHPPY